MKKIIVVEDEFRIRQGLVNLITKINLGCTVVGEAENGYEGLKMIRDVMPDFVITDIRMPKMNGLEMIEKIREYGIPCKFVILSGYAEFEYAQRGIRLGVQDYLLKPVTVTKVKELICKLVQENEEKGLKEEENYSRVVSDMVHTIEKDYGQRLGLDIFAEKYRLTPEYLSVLFARQTGSTFSNFVEYFSVLKQAILRLSKRKEEVLTL